MLNNRTTFMERLNDRVTAIETLLQKLEPIEGLLERLTLLEENIYTTKNVLTFMEACVYIYNSTIEQDFWLSGKDCESIQLPLEWSGSFCIELSVEGKLFVGAFSL